MRQREDALRQREETFRRRLNEELETQVRQARREIDDVIAELKAKTAAIAEARRAWSRPATPARRAATRAPRSTRSRSRVARSGESRAAGRSAIRHPQSAIRNPTWRSATASSSAGSDSKRVVTSVHDGTADLDVRGKRMRASVRDLRVVARAGAGARRASA